METPSRKRGRPRIVVTEAVAEARRLAVQQRNARRTTGLRTTSPGASLSDAGCVPSLAGKHKGGAIMKFFPLNLQMCDASEDEQKKGATYFALCSDSGSVNGLSALESPRRRNHIDRRKASFASGITTHDIGRPDQVCGYCTAQVWAAEFTGRHIGSGPKGYSICCGKGKVHLPLLREAPPELMALLTGNGGRERKFQQNNCMYNTIFALCSFGGTVDEAINNGSGPYVFRVNLQTYHSIGSLVPLMGVPLNLLNFTCTMAKRQLIIGLVSRDIGTCSMQKLSQIPVRLRLLERRSGDGRFVNLPGGNDYEFAGLAIDDNFVDKRDILVDYRQTGLKHINELHPCFMSLQYPLLFPAGEDGFRLGIKHRNVEAAEPNQRETQAVTAVVSQDASVRPDLVARVFKMKLDAMMSDLTKKDVLGRVLAVPFKAVSSSWYFILYRFNPILPWNFRDPWMCDPDTEQVVYTIEFQKRGLPHAHIVLWMAEGDKLLSTEDIDTIISAELPDKETDAVGYEAVSQFMMHGPCGEANPRCPCMAFKDPQAGVKPPGVWKTLPGVISQVRTTNNLQRCKLISGLDIDRYVVEYRASEFFDTTLFNAISITYSRIKPGAAPLSCMAWMKNGMPMLFVAQSNGIVVSMVMKYADNIVKCCFCLSIHALHRKATEMMDASMINITFQLTNRCSILSLVHWHRFRLKRVYDEVDAKINQML
ncbi:hypothetical protein POM88_054624 [Heracleum sosnowskyi]|uniref:Helitron helicase-like domain-containing protein n=1 Tax=Heracleum sosnowskyi TaxID=360622 RepID=A0AAD8LW06_9APIA|nr:hypothetical protein POM88_054624 [Heracleum sosnowskyi]